LSPLVAALDIVWIIALGISMGLLYQAVGLGLDGNPGDHLGLGIAVATLYCTFAHAAHVYTASNLLRLKWQVVKSVQVWLVVFAFVAGLAFTLKIGALFSRGGTLLFFSAGLVITAAARVVVAVVCTRIISSRILAPIRIVLVRWSREAGSDRGLSQLDSYGYSVVAAFQMPSDGSDPRDPAPSEPLVRSEMGKVLSYVRQNSVDEIVLAIPWDRTDLIVEVENELRVLPIPVKLLPDATTQSLLERPLTTLGPTKAIELQQAPLNVVERMLKRVMDQALAATGLVLLIPFLAVIAAAIRLESPGPAIFMQLRAGFNGRPFRIYKFRTMSTMDDGPVVVQAKRNDKRVTRLGSLLRKLSIDEFPQLVNVLRGEMSLVGPRPHALAHDNEYDRLISTYAIRRKMKPGITGWAQVRGFRGETPDLGAMERRVESDIWYIEYWSLWLDIRILLLTVVRVLKPTDVY
jgi:Undecaprenyl-phosphate glucose phosphotransferase